MKNCKNKDVGQLWTTCEPSVEPWGEWPAQQRRLAVRPYLGNVPVPMASSVEWERGRRRLCVVVLGFPRPRFCGCCLSGWDAPLAVPQASPLAVCASLLQGSDLNSRPTLFCPGEGVITAVHLGGRALP